MDLEADQSDEPSEHDVEGEWILTPKAVSAMRSRVRVGSPALVFSPRPNIPLRDKTTFELYMSLTAKGFKEIDRSDPNAVTRATPRPYAPGRGQSFQEIAHSSVQDFKIHNNTDLRVLEWQG